MGYEWKGMVKVDYEEALRIYLNDDICIYLLYDDDTESLVESEADIHEHQRHYGEFGYEARDRQKIKGNLIKDVGTEGND